MSTRDANNLIIYGAGMSGLLAAHMLRRFEPVVHEAASELPNNHAALLRFRSNAVSEATGIPFKKVLVKKAVYNDTNDLIQDCATIRDENCYSFKVTGEIKGRSIKSLAPAERYIAPPDFISQLAKGINIEYNSALKEVVKYNHQSMISTIPMNVLMNVVGWSDAPAFKYQEIAVVTATIEYPNIEIYQTIYYPYRNIPAYRASITGNKLIIEFINDESYNFAGCSQTVLELSAKSYLMHFINSDLAGQAVLKDIGYKIQKYGKLINSTGKLGREFICAMTDLYGIYSVGRFATWRQVLMDDVVKDIKIVESMIDDRDSYSRRLRIA